MTVFIVTREGVTYRVSQDGATTWEELAVVYTESDGVRNDDNVLAIPADQTKFVEVEYTYNGEKNTGGLSPEDNPMTLVSTNDVPIDDKVYKFKPLTF